MKKHYTVSVSDEQVDILVPPTFEPSGKVKPVKEAVADCDWLGSFQLWLYINLPQPALLYQRRTLRQGTWAPGLLDVSAAGYYRSGESGLDGLREVKEELGVDIPVEDVVFFGRKINVNIDSKQRERRSVSDIYYAEYKGTLREFNLEEAELEGVFILPLAQLVDLFAGNLTSFEVQGVSKHGAPTTYTVTLESFPYNFDDYHRRMAEFFAAKFGVSNAYFRH